MEGVLDIFYKWEQLRPDDIFLQQPYHAEYRHYTWKDAGKEARRIASSLQYLGFQPGERIAILSQNCAEWIICDLAMIMGGYISVPLYANVNSETLYEILLHSGSRVLFVGKLPAEDWEKVKEGIPENVITVSLPGYEKNGLVPYDTFLRSDHPFRKVTASPDDILTIIYTSGTTGKSKGVVHTHRTITNAIASAFDTAMLGKPGNRFFSYLPLSHAAERGLVEFGAIFSGGSISFVQSIATFSSDIRHALPTHFFGVPRIWEKFQAKILAEISQEKLDILLKIPGVSFLVRQKIKRALGLHKSRLLISGAAPISQDLMKWFHRLGFNIREAYGMSENFNVCAINPEKGSRIGTVGKLFPNQDLVIDPDTKEIRQRCNWMMQGYYKDPDLTTQTIRDGFLCTGDMGEISKDGYLKISGRVKDIFKTAKGEYISPGKAEMKFLTLREVDQACVLGSHYSQPFMVIVLSEAGKAMKRDELTKLFVMVMADYNQACMDYQKLKKVIIVTEEWTNENKLLTPTLKMKRNAISEKYETQFGNLYLLNEPVSWENQFV